MEFDIMDTKLVDQIIYESNFRLRPIKVNDIELIRYWRNQDDIRKWFVFKDKISAEQQKTWWKKYRVISNDLMFMIELLPENQPIGVVALYNIYLGEKAEFGRLMIGEDSAKGHGFGKKVTEALITWAFRKLSLKQIYLSVYSNNINAIRIYKKAGFVIQKEEDELVHMIIENHVQGE